MAGFFHRRLFRLVMLGSISFSGAVIRAAEPAGNVFYAAAPGFFPQQHLPPLLARELPRQAMLMAAREGLGLRTRDEVMEEWDSTTGVPPDSAGPPLRMDIHWDTDNRLKLNINRVGGGKRVQQITIPVDHKNSDWMDIPSYVVATEAAQDADVALLQSIGYTGTPVAAGDGDLPAAIDDLLYQTTLMSPLSAVQQTDALIRQSGESPARLGALVRGYANLGQLTRFQWSTIHKAMTARSLLYAQKMVRKNPQSAIALYHRAYAFALAGLHTAALDDITAAAALQQKQKDAGQPVETLPAWALLIEPLCNYDVQKLQSMVGDDQRRAPLAALFCFLDVENCGSYSLLTTVGQSMLMPNPACFRIIDGLAANAGIATGHGLTEQPLGLMLQTLPADIKQLPTVPAAVQAAITAAGQSQDHVNNLATVSAAFIGASEDAEPSYTLAGRIIQETNFVHVARRAKFMADSWGVDASQFIEQELPLIKDHRFVSYVRAMVNPAQLRAQRIADLEIPDPQFQMQDLVVQQYSLGKVKGKLTGENAWNRLNNDNDGTAYDLERTFYPFQKAELKEFELDKANHFSAFSPRSGIAMAVRIQVDWKKWKKKTDEVEKDFPQQPAVLAALGEAYLRDKQFDKAEAMLKKRVEIAPDIAQMEELAQVYLAENDEPKWEETLQRVKMQPDLGLDHARVDSEIAEHYMSEGKYEKARPFADASSEESGAGWAMLTASKADEYCGDYAAAEAQLRAECERYGDPEWFFWCKRTGKGDLAAATTAADAFVTARADQKDVTSYERIGMILYLEDQPGKAKPYLELSMRNERQPFAGLLAASICQQHDDAQGRGADLQFVVDNCNTNAKGDPSLLVQLAKLELAAGNKAPSSDQIQPLLDDTHNVNFTNVAYFIGRNEQLTGAKDLAKQTYLLLVANGLAHKYSFELACDELHKMGVTDTPMPKMKPK